MTAPSLGDQLLDTVRQRVGDGPDIARGGRSLIRRGQIRLDDLGPGQVVARVDDGTVADLSVAVLDDEVWQRFVELVAERGSHRAAVLAGELPSDLRDEVAAAGIDLVPPPRSVLPDCTCGGADQPCPHLAALCQLVAAAIDDDPFVLTFWRGRSRSDLIAALDAASPEPSGANTDEASGGAARADLTGDLAAVAPLDGLDPGEAHRRRPGPLPAVALPPPRRSAASIDVAPPIDAGLDTVGLAMLIDDAALRAAAMLETGAASRLADDEVADLARRAAASPSALVAIADRAGRSVDDVRRLAIAWRVGGAAGVAVASAPTPLAGAHLDAARAALGPAARLSPDGCSAEECQLRRGDDGAWWRFERDLRLGWCCAAGPFDDPVDAADVI